MKNKLLGKAFLVLEEIAASMSPLSLKLLSTRLGIHASTLSRITNDLVEAGYLRKANYREFEPALGLIYLGQRAMVNCHFPKKVNRLIRGRCKTAKLQGAVAGVFKDRLVYMYNSSHEEAGDKAGMPFTCHPHSSNIALVVLAKRFGKTKALKVLEDSLTRYAPESDLQERLHFFDGRITELDAEGYSLWIAKDSWNVCVPVVWDDEVFGLALYTTPELAGTKERLIMETSLLAHRVNDLLLDRDNRPLK